MCAELLRRIDINTENISRHNQVLKLCTFEIAIIFSFILICNNQIKHLQRDVFALQMKEIDREEREAPEMR